MLSACQSVGLYSDDAEKGGHDLVSENGSTETEDAGDRDRVSLLVAPLVVSEASNCNRLASLPCSEGVGEGDAFWRGSISGGSSPLMTQEFTTASSTWGGVGN